MADAPITYSETAVALLKANLGYYGTIPSEVETHLTRLLEYAYKRLATTAGINLLHSLIFKVCKQLNVLTVSLTVNNNCTIVNINAG